MYNSAGRILATTPGTTQIEPRKLRDTICIYHLVSLAAEEKVLSDDTKNDSKGDYIPLFMSPWLVQILFPGHQANTFQVTKSTHCTL